MAKYWLGLLFLLVPIIFLDSVPRPEKPIVFQSTVSFGKAFVAISHEGIDQAALKSSANSCFKLYHRLEALTAEHTSHNIVSQEFQPLEEFACIKPISDADSSDVFVDLVGLEKSKMNMDQASDPISVVHQFAVAFVQKNEESSLSEPSAAIIRECSIDFSAFPTNSASESDESEEMEEAFNSDNFPGHSDKNYYASDRESQPALTDESTLLKAKAQVEMSKSQHQRLSHMLQESRYVNKQIKASLHHVQRQLEDVTSGPFQDCLKFCNSSDKFQKIVNVTELLGQLKELALQSAGKVAQISVEALSSEVSHNFTVSLFPKWHADNSSQEFAPLYTVDLNSVSLFPYILCATLVILLVSSWLLKRQESRSRNQQRYIEKLENELSQRLSAVALLQERESTLKTELQNKEEKLIAANNQLLQVEGDAAKYKKEAGTLKANQKEFQSTIALLETEKLALSTQLLHANSKCSHAMEEKDKAVNLMEVASKEKSAKCLELEKLKEESASKLNAASSQLNAKIAQKDEKLKEVQLKLADLNDNLTQQMKLSAKEHATQMESIQRELDEARAKLKASEKAYLETSNKHQAEISVVRKDYEKSKAELCQCEEMKSSLERKMQENELKEKDRANTTLELEKQLKSLNAQLQEQTVQLAAAESKVKDTERLLNEKREENETLTRQVHDLAQKAKEVKLLQDQLQNGKAAAAEQASKRESELSSRFHDKLDALEKQLLQQKQNSEKSEHQLKLKGEEFEALQQQLVDELQRKREIESQLKEKLQEIEVISKQNTQENPKSANGDVSSYKIDELNAAAAAMQAQVTEKDKVIHSIGRELSEVRKTFEILVENQSQQIHHLQTKLSEAEHKLELQVAAPNSSDDMIARVNAAILATESMHLSLGKVENTVQSLKKQMQAKATSVPFMQISPYSSLSPFKSPMPKTSVSLFQNSFKRLQNDQNGSGSSSINADPDSDNELD